MAAILVFFCLIANWPFWPRSSLNILLNFTFESEVKRANLQENKRILKWRPFWNKVYDVSFAVFHLEWAGLLFLSWGFHCSHLLKKETWVFNSNT